MVGAGCVHRVAPGARWFVLFLPVFAGCACGLSGLRVRRLVLLLPDAPSAYPAYGVRRLRGWYTGIGVPVTGKLPALWWIRHFGAAGCGSSS